MVSAANIAAGVNDLGDANYPAQGRPKRLGETK
jgi:hypothetical protein